MKNTEKLIHHIKLVTTFMAAQKWRYHRYLTYLHI